jgi:UDP-N-acetylglucosamine 2-epimerase
MQVMHVVAARPNFMKAALSKRNAEKHPLLHAGRNFQK